MADCALLTLGMVTRQVSRHKSEDINYNKIKFHTTINILPGMGDYTNTHRQEIVTSRTGSMVNFISGDQVAFNQIFCNELKYKFKQLVLEIN